MLKSKLMKIVCLTVTASTVFSCGGQLLADEFVKPGDPEEVTAEETGKRFPGKVNDDIFASDDSTGEDVYFETDDSDVVSSTAQTFEGTIDLSSFDYDYDGYELAEGYISREMTFGRQALDQSYDYRGDLATPSRTAFDFLHEHCANVAAGNESYTYFTMPSNLLRFEFTASDLGLTDIRSASSRKIQSGISQALLNYGFDPGMVIDYMLFACPYELYWMDKTSYLNYYWDYDFNNSSNPTKVIVYNFAFIFPVEQEYQKNGNYLYFDTSYGKAVSASVENAKQIIRSNAGLDDYNKLWNYANAICNLTEYNYQAVRDDRTPYGNPWQMIWVFDGDPNTNVVCEGYSKAFQFLCDNTVFKSGSIYALCAYGDCGGPHMWNVVHMDDGKTYLVDTTNMDDGPNLFLKGGTAKNQYLYYVTADGYTLPYRYDEFMVDYYGSAITLSSTDYVYRGSSNPEPVYKNEWVQDSAGNWYYYDANGQKVSGWQKIGSSWYFFSDKGVMQTGWQKIAGYWYCFRASGSMYSSTWLKWGNSWYYLQSNGRMAIGWLKISGSWYYFNGSGVMLTGWQKISGVWYYLNSNGSMKTGWLKSGGKWYYLSSSGAMVTGWKTIGGYTYYFDSTGAMVTGTVTINGTRYTFDNNGHLIS